DDPESGFTAPECAALQALQTTPGLDDDASVTLTSPDGKTEVDENVTVGDHTIIAAAFQTFADPATAACLTATFTQLLSQPGALPDGVTLTGLEFAQQPLAAGIEAVGYVATITVTGEATGASAPVGIRFDAVRAGQGIAVLSTISSPGAAPIDSLAVAVAAGQKLAAVD
ncbi:MAG: hypothetical protein JWN99_1623, partial [Ilumatobacteraceae bacterium]|nr:hypothetical protein [Ilumatobacteraceae bacterium]